MFKIICLHFIVMCGIFASSATLASAATATSTSTELKDPAAIEKRVREYFVTAPVMIEIAKCESKFRQFTDAGNVLRGGGSAGMIGIFQFYEVIHKSAAMALGFDIETVEGNIGYAKYVYDREGTRPWASCVPDVIPVAPTMSAENKELQIKLLTKVVELLTELLKMELAKGR
jgi:hypothetical protein